MSISLKKDSWFVRDAQGNYRTAAILSTTLPEDAQKIIEDTKAELSSLESSTETTLNTLETNTESKLNTITTNANSTVSQAQAAVNNIESQKNTMIESIAKVAGQGTDTTLTQTGVAADAKATGDEISDLKSSFRYSSMPAKDKPFTGNLYVQRHNFLVGHKYLIRIKYSPGFESFTPIRINASTVDDDYLYDKNVDEHILERLTGDTLYTSSRNEIDLLFSPTKNAPNIIYYVPDISTHIIEITDITKPNTSKLNLKEIPMCPTGNIASGFDSVKLLKNVKYYLEISTTKEEPAIFELTVCKNRQLSSEDYLARLFGGVVCTGVTSALYDFTVDEDSELLVRNHNVYGGEGLYWHIYTDLQSYRAYHELIDCETDVLAYKAMVIPSPKDIGSYYSIFNVNFKAGHKYVINFKADEDIVLDRLAFSTFNGNADEYHYVWEGLFDVKNFNMGSNYGFILDITEDAESLMYLMDGQEVNLEIYVFEYARGITGFYPLYINPVFSGKDVSDPTIWYGDDGYYYCLGSPWTSLTYSLLRSTDLCKWTDTGIYPFDSSITDEFSEYTAGIWAPDCIKIGSCWMMYIALWGPNNRTKIMVCKSSTPYGKFKPVGTITDSKLTGINDTIDPEVVIGEDGHVYLFWGSTSKIWRVQLTDDGLSVAESSTPVHVAGTSDLGNQRIAVFEGAYLYQRDGWWYLFVSSGQFNNETYALRVTRSDSITGTFVDKDGNFATDGKATLILSSKSADHIFYGPGHNSEIFVDKTGKTYMLYHCHDRASEFTYSTPLGNIKSRMLFLQEIKWDSDGWPYFENGVPSSIGMTPII